MKLSLCISLRHMGSVGIVIFICFEERNSLYSMDRGLVNPVTSLGVLEKRKIFFTCHEFLGRPVRSLESIK